ncbi:MAG TPA: hypothetical protein VF745_14645 [Steroidobacteraceae bacterium]
MRESAPGNFWTFEDDLGYYRILRANALEVYSQDIFVRHLSTWQMGVGGVVASKQPLEIDFARNAADSDCPVWSGFRRVIEALVIRELTTAKQLTDAQRKFLGIRFRRIAECVPDPGIWKGIKLLTDALGKHLPLCAVAHYTRFVHVPEAEALAYVAHDTDGTFVVTDALLDRFGVDSLGEWLALMAEAGLLPEPRQSSSSARADLSSASAQTDNPSTPITL